MEEEGEGEEERGKEEEERGKEEEEEGEEASVTSRRHSALATHRRSNRNPAYVHPAWH